MPECKRYVTRRIWAYTMCLTNFEQHDMQEGRWTLFLLLSTAVFTAVCGGQRSHWKPGSFLTSTTSPLIVATVLTSLPLRALIIDDDWPSRKEFHSDFKIIKSHQLIPFAILNWLTFWDIFATPFDMTETGGQLFTVSVWITHLLTFIFTKFAIHNTLITSPG